jgi:hypothetical protein
MGCNVDLAQKTPCHKEEIINEVDVDRMMVFRSSLPSTLILPPGPKILFSYAIYPLY